MASALADHQLHNPREPAGGGLVLRCSGLRGGAGKAIGLDAPRSQQAIRIRRDAGDKRRPALRHAGNHIAARAGRTATEGGACLRGGDRFTKGQFAGAPP
mgnify:CR=1 FL=1